MKNRTLAFRVIVLGCTCLFGCRSAPQLAWWKSRDGAKETALADAAPELPSDAAKRTELAASDPVPEAGGQAAPFVPSQVADLPPTTAAEGEFPSTGIAAYSPENALAAVAEAQLPAAAASGAKTPIAAAMPYDPYAVPASTSSAATATLASSEQPSASRYGAAPVATTPAQVDFSGAEEGVAAGSPPSAAPTVATTAAGGDRYGSYSRAMAGSAQVPTESSGASAPADDTYAPAATSDGLVDRSNPYGSMALTSAPTGDAEPYGAAATAQQTVAVAAGAPYLPGGTSYYPAAGANGPNAVEVAARSQAPPETNAQPSSAAAGSPSPGRDSGGTTLLR